MVSIISTSLQLLIEVKNCQSLKAFNFLNNGPIFNFGKLLVSSISLCLYLSNLIGFRHETRCVREFVVSVVSFSQFSRDFNMKRDV